MIRLTCWLRGHRLGLWYACSFDPQDPLLLWGHISCYRCHRKWHGPAADQFHIERDWCRS